MRCTNEMLGRLRQEADPLADQAIARLFGQGPIHELCALLPALVPCPRTGPAPALPDNVKDWLRANAQLPVWADSERIDRAARIFMKRGVTIALILGTASLVECYAAARGVKALTFSNRLHQDTHRRLMESVHWVSLIMTPGALDEGGPGLWAVYKVRLMHSAIRHLIGRSGRWEAETLGTPLCQEDMAGTLMTFAYTVLRGLAQLDLRLSAQEQEDYLYFWRVVGHMLGVRPELLPENMAEARALTDRIYQRQHGASDEGLQMTRAMLKTYAQQARFRPLQGFLPALTRYLVGEPLANLVQIPRGPWDSVVPYYRWVGALLDFGWFLYSYGASSLTRRRPSSERTATYGASGL